MRNNKPGKRAIVGRNIAMCLVVATATFGGIACCERDTTHPSEPVKVAGTVYPNQRDFVEKMPERCSTSAPQGAKAQELERKFAEFRENNPMRRQPRSVKVEVYFHVITTTKGEGDVSDGAIQNQIDKLNEAFASTPFYFELAYKDRTPNDDWFNMTFSEPAGQAESDAKRLLNRGDNSTLNIYSVNLTGQAFGWARWPWDLAAGVDGVVLGYKTLPGGATAHFNRGYTAAHEVGHWLGLYHTFENGCDGPGDSVDDTPDEASPGRYCPVARNTCSSDGYDPVENYMDFTWDDCMTHFTSGQALRMDEMHQLYRQ